MDSSKKLNKKQLLKMIQELKKDPDDVVGILSGFGLAGVGAVAGGAAAAILGTGFASIPLVTAFTGIGLVVAAPVALVAGSAIVAGAATYGIAQVFKGSGYDEGKRQELLRTYQDSLKEVQAKERQDRLTKSDKSNFYIFLEKPLEFNLISPKDAQALIEAVQNGSMDIKDAYAYVGKIIKESKGG